MKVTISGGSKNYNVTTTVDTQNINDVKENYDNNFEKIRDKYNVLIKAIKQLDKKIK